MRKLLFFAFIAGLLSSCGARSVWVREPGESPFGGEDSPTPLSSDDDTVLDDEPPDDDPLQEPAKGIPPAIAGLYVHSSSALYRYDILSNSLEELGAFNLPSADESMTDIAVNRNGVMVGLSSSHVYLVNPENAECKLLATLSGSAYNALAFVENGFESEQLIAANGAGHSYVIDPLDGSAAYLGTMGSGWGASGDISEIKGQAVIATVSQEGASSDRLVRLDMSSGQAIDIGDSGFENIWGLANWQGTLYGFNGDGQVLAIDPSTGSTDVIASYAFGWWGAAVSTYLGE